MGTRWIFVAVGIALVLAGCARNPTRPLGHPYQCLERVFGNELDDFVAYSTWECGSKGSILPSLVLFKDKPGLTFRVSLRFVTIVRDSDEHGPLRYSINGTRHEVNPTLRRKSEVECKKKYCIETRHYGVRIPWNHIKESEGGIELRYMGEFIEKGDLSKKMVGSLKRLVKKFKWREDPPDQKLPKKKLEKNFKFKIPRPKILKDVA